MNNIEDANFMDKIYGMVRVASPAIRFDVSVSIILLLRPIRRSIVNSRVVYMKHLMKNRKIKMKKYWANGYHIKELTINRIQKYET